MRSPRLDGLARVAVKILGTATALLGLTSCNQLFFAELSLPEVCVTLAGQPFQGQDGGYHADVVFGPQTIDVSSYLSAIPTDSTDLQIRVLSGSLIAKGGVPDLGFIDTLHLDVEAPPASGLEGLHLIQYDRDPSHPTPGVIQLVGSEHPNVVPYLEAKNISTTVHIAGTLPANDWTADLTVCVSAKAKVYYLEAAEGATKSVPSPKPDGGT